MKNQDVIVFMYSRGKYIKLQIKKNRKNFHKTLFKAHKWKKYIKRIFDIFTHHK
jgi:hypothetical protein